MSLIIKEASNKTIKHHNYEKIQLHTIPLTSNIFRQQRDILCVGFYFQGVLMKVTIKLQYKLNMYN
jgi:hypothetical protein